jgi:hypothetical protein
MEWHGNTKVTGLSWSCGPELRDVGATAEGDAGCTASHLHTICVQVGTSGLGYLPPIKRAIDVNGPVWMGRESTCGGDMWLPLTKVPQTVL